MVKITPQTIGKYLRVPMHGVVEEQLPVLTRKQHEVIYEGDYLKATKVWKIERARQDWKPWFKFVNHYFLFRLQSETMARKQVTTTIQTWEGKQVNWSFLIHKKCGKRF